MIGYLSGKIISIKPTEVLLDVNGVGYKVNITIKTFEKISSSKENVGLFTHLAVKEDALDLYGFSAESEKEMFLLLVSISGIGPKLAIGILSGIQIDELQEAIKLGDIARIVATPGVGKKTAERLIIELRDKVDSLAGKVSGTNKEQYTLTGDAVSALTSLGYNNKLAEKTVRELISQNNEIKLEELIRKALSTLNK